MSNGIYYGSRRVAIWAIFDFLGGLTTYCSRLMRSFTKIKSYRHLCTHVKEDSSAWAEVWADTRCPTASIMAPGGSDLGDFRLSGRADDILFSPLEANYQNQIISSPMYIRKGGF